MAGQGVKSRNLTLRSHFGADRHSTLSLATLYFALFFGNPMAGGSEPNGTGAYTRAPKTNDATLWGTIAATDVQVTNAGSSGGIVWPSATGLYSITSPFNYWAAFDLSAGGVLWYYGQLQTPIQVTAAGDVPRIPVSTLTILQPE